MEGTEKQVKWAEDIKVTMITCLENKLIAANKKFGDVEMPEKSKKVFNLGLDFIKEKLEEIKQQEKATWFIDRREHISRPTILNERFKNKKYVDMDVISLFGEDPNSLAAKSVKVMDKYAKNEYIELF